MRGTFTAIGLMFWFTGAVWAQEPASPSIPPTTTQVGDLDAENPLRNLPSENGATLRRLPPDTNSTEHSKAPGGPARTWLKRLREDLRSGDSFRAISAVAKLRDMGSAGASALVDTLKTADLDFAVSNSVLRALDDIGPSAVPALIRALEEDNDKTWNHIGHILSRLGPRAAAATPVLVRVLRDPASDISRRFDAVSLLGHIGPGAHEALPALLDEFERGGDDDLRVASLKAVAEIGRVPASSADRLLQFLLDEGQDARLRVAASHILVRQRPLSPAVLPALIGLLHPSFEDRVCREAVEAIGQLGPDAADSLPALEALLKHESNAVRVAAADAIGCIGAGAQPAVATLVRLVQADSDDNLRGAAGMALGSLGPAAIAELVKGLGSDNLEVRENTLAAIAAIGPPAKAAENTVVQLLQDAKHSDSHLACIHALQAIRADAALARAPLVRVLASSSQTTELRAAAANALHEIGGDLQTVLPLLTDILRNRREDPAIRAVAALSLGKISRTVIPDLYQALQDECLQVRLAAAQALCLHDESRQHGLSALIRELAFPEHVESAGIILEWAGPPAIPELGIVLRDKGVTRDHRIAAANVLGHIGGQAAELLVATLSDEDEDVASAAGKALLDVGPRNAVPPLIVAIDQRVAAARRDPGSGRHQRVLKRMRQLIVDLNGGMGGAPRSMAMPAPTMAAPPPVGVHRDEVGSSSDAMPTVGAEPPPKPAEDHSPSISAPAKASAVEKPPEWKAVKVFYGTNRKPVNTLVQRRQMEWHGYLPVMIVGSVTMLLSAVGFALSRSLVKAALAGLGLVATLALAYPATQRTVELERSAASRPGPVYGGESNDALELGTCEVTIPATHHFGELESASLWKMEVSQDPHKHIVVRSVRRYETESFYSELKQDLTNRGPNILVFVHGYNVSFDDAARRTAQMAYDLEFPGVPLFFSWPSQGNWYEYREDERQVELAVNPLKAFLLEVSHRSGATSIHLVAHSMGSRALTAALREIEIQSGEQQKLFNQVVLAAPDIDAEVFRQRIVPAITSKAQRVTLYASSNDLALSASRTFNSGDLRAGDSSHGLVVVPGVDTIDVSEVDTSLLGHSYYGDNPTVLTDLKDVLLFAKPADDRSSLEPMTRDDLKYWIFRAVNSMSRSDSSAQQR